MSETNQHDLGGLKCPMPIIRLNRIMSELAAGQACTVTADDPAFCMDVQAWCRKTANELVQCTTENGQITAIIRKSA